MVMNSLVPISTVWFCFKLIFEFSSFEADTSDILLCFEGISVFATLDMKIISISTNFGAKWHLLKQVTLHYAGVMETFVHSIISLPSFFFSLSLVFQINFCVTAFSVGFYSPFQHHKMKPIDCQQNKQTNNKKLTNE